MGKTVEQALWYPSAMLEELHALARQSGRSAGAVVEEAWRHARSEVAKLDGNSAWRAEAVFEQRYADSDKVKHVLTLGTTTMDEIKDEAARLDRSMSWLVARCFCVVRDELAGGREATTRA